jgi:alpha-tubulin suppressor-like RCC1 family protein
MNSFKKSMIVPAILVACVAAQFLACTVEHGLDTTNGSEFARTFYEAGGGHPAGSAVVRVFDAAHGGGDSVHVFVTDENGRLSLKGLAEGIYAVWAQKDSFVLFQDSVVVTSLQTTLRDDTLEPPATVSGIVGLQNYHDPRSVTVQVAGIDKPAVFADGGGRFTLTGMAGGNWKLVFRSSIFEYLPTEKTINLAPASGDTIDDTIRLYFSGIPVVSGITFSQDTLKGLMRLSWRKPAYKIIRDYLIYRDSCSGASFSKTPASITEDTTCVDSIYFSLKADSLDTAQRCLVYRIAIRNTVPLVGAFCSSMQIPFAPKSSATTFFSHRVRYVDDTARCASVHDTVTIFLAAKNRSRWLRSLVWIDQADGDTVSTKRGDAGMPPGFADTLHHAFNDTGTNRLVAIVTDGAGAEWRDTVSARVIPNTLAVEAAAADTFVYSSDTIHLHGKAQSRFGGIAVWEWKVGSGFWNKTSSADTSFRASSFNGIVVCSLAVTDEDGNRVAGGVKIHIIDVADVKNVKIAVGGRHELYLDDTKTLRARGVNIDGQLGARTTLDWIPWRLMMTDVSTMDAGESFSLAVKTDGTLYACGINESGQLGDGTTVTRFDPVKVQSDVKDVSAGADYSLILKADGTLWACGSNRYGQLGDGTTTDRKLPVPVMSDVQRMSAGATHSLILKTDGSLWACGANTFGQLGDGTRDNRSLPVKVMTGVWAVDAGAAHSLILKSDGTLWACGLNHVGQLGDGTTTNRLAPVHILNDVQDMAAGDYHSAILKTDRSVWCCGANDWGQLGDSTETSRLLPVKTMSAVQGVFAGCSRTLVIQNNRTMWICGWVSYDADFYGGTDKTSIPERLIPE